MGSSVSKAEKLHKDKKEELKMLMKVLDSKRAQFMAEVINNRGSEVSESEVNGGRSVVRQSEMRVASQDAPNKQIKDAIGSFFEAAQGGNTGRSAVIEGATSLVSAGLDAIFGVSAGQGMEKRGFTVLFLNFAFVRVDYYVYTYCVTGKKWASESSVSGSVQVTDLAVLDPATLNPMEIDYLIAQNITVENDDDASFEVLMQIKVMLATSSVLNRIIKSPDTDFDTLTKTLEQIRGIMQALAGELEKLPSYENDAQLLSKDNYIETLKEQMNAGDATSTHILEFIQHTDGLGLADDAWDNLVTWTDPKAKHSKDEKERFEYCDVLFKKQYFAQFRRAKLTTNYNDLSDMQKTGVRKLFGYNKESWNQYEPTLPEPGKRGDYDVFNANDVKFLNFTGAEPPLPTPATNTVTP